MNSPVVLLHGWQGNDADHWQNHLAKAFQESGRQVIYPQFPNADEPLLADWLSVLDDELSEAILDQMPWIVSHSLGGILWFHYTAIHSKWATCPAIFVAPAVDVFHILGLADFYPCPYAAACFSHPESILVGSDNDPYVSREHFEWLSSQTHLPFACMIGKGHLNTEAGYGRWEKLEQKLLLGK